MNTTGAWKTNKQPHESKRRQKRNTKAMRHLENYKTYLRLYYVNE